MAFSCTLVCRKYLLPPWSVRWTASYTPSHPVRLHLPSWQLSALTLSSLSPSSMLLLWLSFYGVSSFSYFESRFLGDLFSFSNLAMRASFWVHRRLSLLISEPWSETICFKSTISAFSPLSISCMSVTSCITVTKVQHFFELRKRFVIFIFWISINCAMRFW